MLVGCAGRPRLRGGLGGVGRARGTLATDEAFERFGLDAPQRHPAASLGNGSDHGVSLDDVPLGAPFASLGCVERLQVQVDRRRRVLVQFGPAFGLDQPGAFECGSFDPLAHDALSVGLAGGAGGTLHTHPFGVVPRCDP